jgi:hypothetical protein
MEELLAVPSLPPKKKFIKSSTSVSLPFCFVAPRKKTTFVYFDVTERPGQLAQKK